MSDPPARRGVFAVLVVGVVALVCLLLGHKWLEGYVGEQRAKHPAPAPDVARGGVAGRVTFADGSPAGSIRVGIAWRDSAGRPGETLSVTDADGAFRQGRVPVNATVLEVEATMGPLAAKAGPQSPRGEGASGVAVVLPAEFRLAGLVRRAGDRAAVAGATLEVSGVRATTGAAGEFAVEHVAASALLAARPVVHVTAVGFEPLDWPLPKDALPETYGDLTILLEAAK